MLTSTPRPQDLRPGCRWSCSSSLRQLQALRADVDALMTTATHSAPQSSTPLAPTSPVTGSRELSSDASPDWACRAAKRRKTVRTYTSRGAAPQCPGNSSGRALCELSDTNTSGRRSRMHSKETDGRTDSKRDLHSGHSYSRPAGPEPVSPVRRLEATLKVLAAGSPSLQTPRIRPRGAPSLAAICLRRIPAALEEQRSFSSSLAPSSSPSTSSTTISSSTASSRQISSLPTSASPASHPSPIKDENSAEDGDETIQIYHHLDRPFVNYPNNTHYPVLMRAHAVELIRTALHLEAARATRELRAAQSRRRGTCGPREAAERLLDPAHWRAALRVFESVGWAKEYEDLSQVWGRIVEGLARRLEGRARVEACHWIVGARCFSDELSSEL